MKQQQTFERAFVSSHPATLDLQQYLRYCELLIELLPDVTSTGEL